MILCYNYVKLEGYLMNDYINDFIDYLVVEKGLSNNTQESYRFDLLDFSKYLEDNKLNDLSSLNESDIINYLTYLKILRN